MKNIGLQALIIFSLSTDMAVRQHRIQSNSAYTVRHGPVISPAGWERHVDNRGVPYFRRTDASQNNPNPVFYHDTPITPPAEAVNLLRQKLSRL